MCLEFTREIKRNPNYPKISIITVCYNSEKFLEKAINSVAIQDYPNIEYIIVDGGSTDGTLDIIKKNEKYITKWVSEPDEGIYDAMNKGIDMASGDFVAFLNSDDWYVNGAIAHVAEDIKKGVASVLCYEINMVDNNRIIPRKGEQETDAIQVKMIYCHQAVFAERVMFQKYGKFDVRYKITADYDWLLRLYNNDVCIKYDNYIVVNFRRGGFSTVHMLETQREACSVALEALNTLKERNKISEVEYSERKNRIEKYYMETEGCQLFKLAIKENWLKKDSNIIKGLRDLLPEKQYSIFGCGILGEECLSLLKQLGIEVVCFWDNNKEKWGKRYHGYNIKSPEEIKKGESVVLVSIYHFQDEIDEQLRSKGLTEGIDFLNFHSIRVKAGRIMKERNVEI